VCGLVEIELLGDLRHVFIAASVDVDPKKLGAVQPLRPAWQLVEMIDLLPIEKNRAHSRIPVQQSAERMRASRARSGLGIHGHADRVRGEAEHRNASLLRYACGAYRVLRVMRLTQKQTWREVARRVANVTLVLWVAVAAVGVLLIVGVIR
jgi:hypothetical protein